LTNPTFAHGRNRITYELLTRSPVKTLLDYGCGHAQFALAAADELGLEVYAGDADPALVAQLQAEHRNGVTFFQISEQQPRLPLRDGQASAVICCDVLEHMDHQARLAALREMHRVLAGDGAIVVTTPHKGLFSVLDPENAKYHFPAAHRLLYKLVKGRAKYEERYGGERYGNFSAGSSRHLHFSASELSQMLNEAGFEVHEVRYFMLVYPLVRTVLWGVESLAKRVPALSRLGRLLWRVYLWDADLEPGRLGFCIAVRALPRG
jgi:ubiquinone/menaquinone biosynthesis C-methylase UbiE